MTDHDRDEPYRRPSAWEVAKFLAWALVGIGCAVYLIVATTRRLNP